MSITAAVLALTAFTLATRSALGQDPPTPSKADDQKPHPTRKLSPSEVAALEKEVADNPTDLEARTRLLAHYFTERGDEVRAVRARHVLWVIGNAPDADIAGRPDAGFQKHMEADRYAEARALWLHQVDANPKNPQILANAAHFLLLDDRPEAESLLRRSAELDATNPRWKEQLGHLYELEARRGERADPVAARKALEQYEAALAAGSPSSGVLAQVAQCALWAGDDAKAASYASDLLRRASAPTARPDGDAIHDGHRILGHVALNAGDIDGAKMHLLESAKTPGSPALSSFGPELTLAKELLAKGEREAVIQYLQSLPRFWPGREESIDEWVILIRAGKTPDLDRFRARRTGSPPRPSSSPTHQP